MKKSLNKLAVLFIAFIISNNLNAQNTLEFNRVVKVDNNVQSVPSGTVWKIVSVYGNAPRICISHPKATITGKTYNWFNVQGFIVDGVNIYSETSFAGYYEPASSSYGHYWYADANCSTSPGWDQKLIWGIYNIDPNPNILPMWLEAGTNVQAMQGSYLSVIEFNVN